jgi:glucans biosynthesis protein C
MRERQDTLNSSAGRAQAGAVNRLFFVDNLRVYLTILVLLHHLMITYTGTGSWYYQEGRQDILAAALGTWFQATNQAYFMGLFLLISAYFVPGSYDRKGPRLFLKDRLIRLGIPLALYSWVLRPVLVYLDPIQGPRGSLPPLDFLGRYFQSNAIIGSGPLWFIETLLIFSLVYVLWRLATASRNQAVQPVAPDPASNRAMLFPGNAAIAIFALLLGLAAFVVRLWLPMMWSFQPLNLQFPFFVQYIALFVVGLIAYRRNWLQSLPAATGRLWIIIAVVAVFLFWPLMIGGGALTDGIDLFLGGWRWQALAYALWESFVCVSMCIGLVYLFRQRANVQGSLARYLSRNAYTAYLVHGPVIVTIAYAVRDAEVYPLLKWLLVALVAVPACFLLSSLIRKLPGTERVL